LDSINKLRLAFSLPAVRKLTEWKYSMKSEKPVNDPLGEMLQGVPAFGISDACFELFNIDSEPKAKDIAAKLDSAGIPNEVHKTNSDSYVVHTSVEFSRPLVNWVDWYGDQLPFHRSGGKTSRQRDEMEEAY
jgi:hypothetical protein